MINLYILGRRIARFFTPRQPSGGLSFFEVKEQYHLAYEQKAQARNALRRFRRMEAKARAMDDAYRAQLGLVRRAA